MPNSRVVLAVDGNSLVHRSFHAQAGTGLRSVDGAPMWAVRGLLSQLVAAVDRICPDVVVVGFDDPAASIRRELWPQYKATRTDKLATLVAQLTMAATMLSELGVNVVVPAGLEADDVLASVARLAPTFGASTMIMTSDRDSFALIDDNTSVLRIINGGVEASPVLTPSRLVTLLGITPGCYRDFAALRGDPSDNLPGVRGIGPKTAAKLLCALGSARAAFDDLAEGGSRVSEVIGAGGAAKLAHPDARAAWELNCQVMRLHSELRLDLTTTGGLPLDATAVRAAFDLLQLPATGARALRVLAHFGIDAEVGAPPPAETFPPPGWSGAARGDRADPARPGWADRARGAGYVPGRYGDARTGRSRYGRLTTRPAPSETDQLVLF